MKPLNLFPSPIGRGQGEGTKTTCSWAPSSSPSPSGRRNVWAVLAFLLIAPSLLLADAASTSYSLTADEFNNGYGALLTSSNYKVEESSLGEFEVKDITSANYTVPGKIGFTGTPDLPVVQSVSPGDLKKFYMNEEASYTLAATSPGGTAPQYQARQDGTLKGGPQSSGTLSWSLSPADKGAHQIKLEALHPNGSVAQEQRMYVTRRPVK